MTGPGYTTDARFDGIRRLYGAAGIAAIAAGHVAVIGLGGVGSWAAEALARTGVGALTLVDLDEVCVSNVNRQIHALDGTVGRAKVAVMDDRIRAIHPSCELRSVESFLTLANMAEVLTVDVTVVLDAIDNPRVKAALVATCLRRRIPVVSVGAAGGRVDPTRIRVDDLARVQRDALLARVRDHLRRHHNLVRTKGRRYGVECVYSPEAVRFPKSDGSVCERRSAAEGSLRLDCTEGFGAVSFVTGTFGFMAASRCVARLLRRAADAPATEAGA